MPGFNKSGGSSGPSPSASVTSETAFGQAAAVGVSVDYSRGDHTHGTPASPIPAHEAAGDPHPAYALDSDLSTHAAAPDPHPAYALDSDLSAHAAAADPHPNYALDSDLTAHATAADPHAVYQLESEKGAVNGYAGLGADSFVPTAQLGSGTPDTTKFLRGDKSWVSPTASAAWGSITGTLSAQTDLQTALDGKSATGHNHDATYQALSGKNAASGYAGLDASSKLTGSQQVYGTGVNTACQGNDSRLSDARTPTAHAVSHETGGADAVKLDELAAPTDITTLNASITAHGLLPKLGGGTSNFLRADGTWSAPGSGSPTGVLSDLQMSILQSDGTLSAAAGVQTWAGTNKTAQDVFTVTANTTYRVRGRWIVNTGATTHTTAMAFALATATVTDFQYLVMLWSAAANTIATAQSTTHVTGVASKVLNATSAAVYTIIQFEGILAVGTGGTITPQINFSANPTGTNLMKRGSWTSFEKLGADTVTVVGGWA